MDLSEVDVVVIGAGAAGLHAAAQLGRAGHTVELLEGRDRIGGRMWSPEPAGWPGPIELGAEFIHGGNPVLEKLMRRARIQKRPLKEKHWLIRNGVREELPDVWDRIDEVMQKIGPQRRGAFAPWMASHRERIDVIDRTLAEEFVRGFQGAPPSLMSVRTLFEASKTEDKQFRIPRGYGDLVAALQQRLPRNRVHLSKGTIVTRIEWRRGRATVFTDKRAWNAQAVLITVPLGVLQARPGQTGAIRFRPALTTRERLWRKLPTGHALRVVVRLRADVWKRGVMPAELRADSGQAFGFLHSDEEFFPVWWAEAPDPVIVGWTGGPAAKALAGRPDREVFARAQESLARLLGCGEAALARSIVDWRKHDWTADPLTRCAYSFSVAGQENAPRILARPIAGTLFFAGEATADPLELGTVHGALSSGERAAGGIIARLKRGR